MAMPQADVGRRETMEIELKFGGLEFEIKGIHGLVTLAGMALLAAAIAQELQLPPAQRRWTGKVLGGVPYDLRPPTLDRVRERLWNPESDEILTPEVFGVGWTVNFGAVAKKLGLAA
jgi:hypothetical protein